MPVVVQKFGGTSVADPPALLRISDRIVAAKRAGSQVIAVVSAMGQTTDEMERLARQVNPEPPRREMDMLVTAGERITMALVAMAIYAKGERAISFTGSQSGIITDTSHGNARIKDVRPIRIHESLADDLIVIVAGFQGVSEEKEVTTLGRGGSDLTAVALAATFEAERCELYKDVDGVMTADPRISPNARLLETIPARAMLALAEAGADVLHDEAVRFAMEKGVEITVRCSLNDSPGTRITFDDVDPSALYGLAVADSDDGTRTVTLVGGLERLASIESAGLPGAPPTASPPPPQRLSDFALSWAITDRSAADALIAHAHRRLFEE